MTQLVQVQTDVVKVDLLLAGGHRYRVNFNLDDPMLHHLMQAVLDAGHGVDSGAPHLFQIPLDQGRAALYFSRQQLVGLATEPALDLQQSQVPDAPNPEIIPSPFVQLEGFLTPQEQQALFEHVLAKEKEFAATSTSTQAASYRESRILHDLGGFRALMLDRILQMMPDVCRHLNLPAFTISEIESQLTVHNDGNYYKIHNDNGSPETATRELTYVYYFYQEPKPFSGGELLIYDSKVENNYYVAAKSFQTVEPRNNSIVFFLSRYMHEVLPIRCPSQQFRHGRFTINGWVRR